MSVNIDYVNFYVEKGLGTSPSEDGGAPKVPYTITNPSYAMNKYGIWRRHN